MKDDELDYLINQLEDRSDISVAEFDAVVRALRYVLPDQVSTQADLAKRMNNTDDAMHIADHAFPNWSIHIKGRTNDRNGNWQCTIRESDQRDSGALIGIGRSPVLSQAVLAAVLRLAVRQSQQT